MVTRWLGAAHLVVERHHAAVFPVREAEGGQQHAADVGLGDRAVNVRHHDPGRAAHQVQAGGRPHHAAGARLHPAHLAPVHCTCTALVLYTPVHQLVLPGLEAELRQLCGRGGGGAVLGLGVPHPQQRRPEPGVCSEFKMFH